MSLSLLLAYLSNVCLSPLDMILRNVRVNVADRHQYPTVKTLLLCMIYRDLCIICLFQNLWTLL